MVLTPDPPPTSIEAILTAILDDDPPTVEKLLKTDPRLATALIDRPRLYQSKILHWIYVGDTALHLAAAGHRVELVRLLLDAGADPNSTSNHRQSGPLHYAADGCISGPCWNTKSQVKTIQCLLEAGCDATLKNKPGSTPFHLAVQNTGHGGSGTQAARAAQRQIIREFLSYGLNPALKDSRGKSVFDSARSSWVRNILSENAEEPG